MSKRFNILSLSGGGYMGLYTAHVLAHLEERSGRPLRESFDLIAGTSVGGILGLAVALGVPMREVAMDFEESGPRIFSDRPPPLRLGGVARDMLRYLNRSKYDNSGLHGTLLRFVPPELRLRDLEARLIIPAVNLSRSAPVTFRTPHLSDHTNSGDLRALEVGLAACAAPTLFPVVEIEGSYYCDGVIYANSPDHLALHECEGLLGRPVEDISMLSIGTTTERYEFPEPVSPSFGLRQWVDQQLIIRMTLAAQQQSAHRVLQQRLGARYIRLDATQDRDHAPHLGLDVATPMARDVLRDLAGETGASLGEIPGLDAILAHSASAPRFYSEPTAPKPDPVFLRTQDFLAWLMRRGSS